ncbi:MAG: hypothetical protein QW279_08225, partial [Candidatus Jordarchaeaceae archaeon]
MERKHNSKETTHLKRTHFFNSKTKHLSLLIPIILLLTSILTISLAASQATALPSANIGIPLNANTVSTINSSVGSKALIGSNLTNPTVMDINGNILMGEHSPDKLVYMNMTNYYQLIESNGTGFIGTGYTGPESTNNNTLPLYTSDCIRVPEGNGYLLVYDAGSDKIYVGIKFNYTHAVLYDSNENPVLEIVLADYGVTDGTVNITAILLEMDPNFEPTVVWGHGIMWNESIVIETWGPWFGAENATINMTNTHLHIESEGSIVFQFLNSLMEVEGTSYIKGPVTVTGPLKINGGTMTGTGTINIPYGYMQTLGSMRISNGEIRSGSPLIITGENIDISGMVTNVGSVTLSGMFLLAVPMSIAGKMVTLGVTSMGGLGTINGIISVTGNIMMSGLTMINGENNIIGSMTVTPLGVFVNGLVGLMGIVQTSGMPDMSFTTILETVSSSVSGLSVPHVFLLANPYMLVAIGILGIGTIWVIVRSLYYGIKYRQTLPQRVKATLKGLGRRLRLAS